MCHFAMGCRWDQLPQWKNWKISYWWLVVCWKIFPMSIWSLHLVSDHHKTLEIIKLLPKQMFVFYRGWPQIPGIQKENLFAKEKEKVSEKKALNDLAQCNGRDVPHYDDTTKGSWCFQDRPIDNLKLQRDLMIQQSTSTNLISWGITIVGLCLRMTFFTIAHFSPAFKPCTFQEKIIIWSLITHPGFP